MCVCVIYSYAYIYTDKHTHTLLAHTYTGISVHKFDFQCTARSQNKDNAICSALRVSFCSIRFYCVALFVCENL